MPVFWSVRCLIAGVRWLSFVAIQLKQKRAGCTIRPNTRHHSHLSPDTPDNTSAERTHYERTNKKINQLKDYILHLKICSSRAVIFCCGPEIVNFYSSFPQKFIIMTTFVNQKASCSSHKSLI